MDMNNTDIIHDMVVFNKEEQIKTRIQLCEDNPSLMVCSHVDKNTYEHWYNYYSQNENANLFSKGINRLETWDKLFQNEPILYFSKEIIPADSKENDLLQNIIKILKKLKAVKPLHYFFIFAGLIIIFQVFGDANHRTANFFYKKMTGKDMTRLQEKYVNNELLRKYEYYSIENTTPIYTMNEIIIKLIKIISTVNGGKRKSKKSRIKDSTKAIMTELPPKIWSKPNQVW